MDAAGLTVSVVQTIFAALQCSELKELFGSDLESLERSVAAINSVLLDLDTKQANGLELSAQEKNYIEKIKPVVYDADDLLDAYVTRAQLKQLRAESSNELSKKVRGLCSSLKNLIIASPEVKKTARKLVEIGRDAQNNKFDNLPVRRREREETCSYVNEDHIVGREDDQRRIVDMLLNPIVQGDQPVLAIVGVGGLGKTALAQLVYNDPRIQKEFSLRLWVCVSDQGGNQFNAKAILMDIYKSAAREKSIGDLGLELLVQELRSILDQNKYLLVLDDLWSEKTDECHKLVDMLIGKVQSVSRIVVTTRSKRTAKAIGSNQPYELRGLSDEDSWRLFELKVGKEIEGSCDLFGICKDIVQKCANVPLAIKVVGSLLHDLPENEWEFFEIKKDDNDIMLILKFSYYHLSPSLKSCFTYCALFPKDFEIPKEKIISMWTAHDYVKDEFQAEYYFKVLVQRCFFQDVKEDYVGEIKFKIHDLMHDMAQEVAGKEIFIADSATTKLDKEIRHLYDVAPASCTKGFVIPAKVRTYVHNRRWESASNMQFHVSALLTKWRHLRVLDLCGLRITSLPDSIGELLHLRHLDLSGNEELDILTEAFTKLINLQFLNLDDCGNLKELPKDLSKLVNLRTLYVPFSLEYMPLGMAKMTRLTRLNTFRVGQRKSCLKQEDKLVGIDLSECDGLQELPWLGGLQHLKTLQLWRLKNVEYTENRTSIGRGSSRDDGAVASNSSTTIFFPSLQTLHLKDNPKLKGWWRGTSSNSTSGLGIVNSDSNLLTPSAHPSPSFPHLSELRIEDCPNLSSILVCPALETLELRNLNERFGILIEEDEKGGGGIRENSRSHYHPKIREIDTDSVMYLRALPMEAFRCLIKMRIIGDKKVESLSEVEELFRGCSSSLCSLTLRNCKNLRSVSPGGLEYLTALEQLQLSDLPELRSVSPGGLEYLTALEQLKLSSLPELRFDETEEKEEDEEGTGTSMPWRCLGQSLRSLTLYALDKVVNLPNGMRYLTALQSLDIENLPLKDVPEWIKCLSSLHSLQIRNCKELESLPRALRNLTSLKEFRLLHCDDKLRNRCRKPDGEYWPILEHIPNFNTTRWG